KFSPRPRALAGQEHRAHLEPVPGATRAPRALAADRRRPCVTETRFAAASPYRRSLMMVSADTARRFQSRILVRHGRNSVATPPQLHQLVFGHDLWRRRRHDRLSGAAL